MFIDKSTACRDTHLLCMISVRIGYPEDPRHMVLGGPLVAIVL